MSKLMLRRKGAIRAAVISAAGLLGAAVPLAAFGAPGMTINLQLSPGIGGIGGGTVFLDPTKNNAPINVYVYATVTGTGPASSTDFQGMQYAYYNINNQGPTTGSMLAASVTGVTLGTNFVANGSQPGALANSGNLAIGSSSAITSVAKPRSGAAVFDNSPDGTQIYVNNATNSASFLLETLQYTPTAFTASTLTNAIRTTLVPALPSAATLGSLVGANWFQDTQAIPPLGQAPATGVQNGTPNIGSTVTFVDTLVGDANDNGTVNVTDLGILSGNINQPGTFTWAQGDFNATGTVNVTDLGLLSGTINQGSLPLGPDVSGFPAAQIAGAADVSIPEPSSLALLGLGGLSLLRRRRGATKA